MSWEDDLVEESQTQQRPQQSRPVGRAGSAMVGLAQGATFGLADEAAAAITAPFNKWFGNAESWRDAYRQAHDVQQQNIESAKAAYPGTALGGELASGLGGGLALAKGGVTLMNQARGLGSNLLRGGAEGAAYGAAYGAGQANPGERLEGAQSGALMGGAGGAVASPVASGIQRAASGIRTATSPAHGAGRVLRSAAGDDAPYAAQLLRQYDPNSTLTPRSAGEIVNAAENPQLAALQRIADVNQPSQALSRDLTREQARVAALRAAPGTNTSSRELYRRATDETAPRFRAVEDAEGAVPVDDVLQVFSEALDTHSREGPVKRVISEAMSAVAPMADDGVLTPGQALSARRALGDLLDTTSPERSLNRTSREIVTRAKTLLEEQLMQVPEYAQASDEFARLIAPANRTAVSEGLVDALEPAVNMLGGRQPQRANAFASALRDPRSLVRQNTGMRQQDLPQIFEGHSEGLRALGQVGEDIGSQSTFNRMASAGGAPVQRAVSELGSERAPPTLIREFMLANAALSRIGKASRQNSLDFLSEVMRDDPQRVARLLENIPVEEAAAVRALIQSLPRASGIMAAGE